MLVKRLMCAGLFFLLLSSCGGGGKSETPSTPSSKPAIPSTSSSTVITSSAKSSSAMSTSVSLSSSSKLSSSAASTACGDTEVQAVFTNNTCLVCHAAVIAAVGGGGLNLETGDVGLRLLNQPTAFGGTDCQSEKLIDSANASNSLLLKLISANAHAALNSTSCKRNSMPQTGKFMSTGDLACVTSWVGNVIKTKAQTSSSVVAQFAPANAGMALQKAKTILHGGAATSAELTAVGGSTAIPNRDALINAIIEWEKTPQYQSAVEDFLRLSLQQKAGVGSYNAQFKNLRSVAIDSASLIDATKMIDNLDKMYVRTAWNIVNSDQDFRQVITTRKWQVTTAVLAGLVWLDKGNQTAGRKYYQFPAIPDMFRRLAYLNVATDYSDWRTVELTQGTTSAVYSNTATFVAGLRAIPDNGKLSLLFPRVGFFSTPEFLDGWATNEDNDFRVTTNQALIGALNKSISASDPTPHLSENGINTAHTSLTSGCYQCHQHLDPMRQVFSKYQYSNSHAQTPDPLKTPSFSFLGVSKNFTTMDEFAAILANHPEFAKGWVQKLCVWGNSTRCDEADPEFTSLVDYFTANTFNMRLLMRQFFSSPIFTGASKTLSHTTNEFIVSISRGNHFCMSMDSRLQQLKAVNGTTGAISVCANRDALGTVSNDQFARGAEHLVQGVAIGAFDSKSIDKECMNLSNSIFALTNTKIINYSAIQGGVDKAIGQLVEYIIGLPPNHSRYAASVKALKDIYSLANNSTACAPGVNPAAQGATITCGYQMSSVDSLRSAWFAACTSPEIVSVGM